MIQHHAIPNDMTYSEYVNSLPYKYVIPQGEPVDDGQCKHYLMKVTPYEPERDIYGDPDEEQALIDEIIYG